MPEAKNPRVTIDNLIEREAREIARQVIEHQLQLYNLPPPKEIDLHIDQLINIKGYELRQQAQKRVELKQDAYTEALRAIGLEPNLAQPLDLDT